MFIFISLCDCDLFILFISTIYFFYNIFIKWYKYCSCFFACYYFVCVFFYYLNTHFLASVMSFRHKNRAVKHNVRGSFCDVRRADARRTFLAFEAIQILRKSCCPLFLLAFSKLALVFIASGCRVLLFIIVSRADLESLIIASWVSLPRAASSTALHIANNSAW